MSCRKMGVKVPTGRHSESLYQFRALPAGPAALFPAVSVLKATHLDTCTHPWPLFPAVSS